MKKNSRCSCNVVLYLWLNGPIDLLSNRIRRIFGDLGRNLMHLFCYL